MKQKNLTVENLTDSILSVYGDIASPAVWADYVNAVQSAFGSHPIGAAHAEAVSPAFAARWYAAFGIA